MDGGTYLFRIPCDPYPCPTPFACCYDNGTCELLTLEDCVASGGEFLGPFVLCDPNPCETTGIYEDPPIEEMTWGRVKSRYR